MKNYTIVKTLGTGGFGKAYLAARNSDQLQVCVKEMHLSGNDKVDLKDSLEEVRILRTLDHKFIVRYIDHFNENENFYIVMEFADGGNLDEKIKARRNLFSETEVLNYFIQMALAIAHVHSKHILHRDLKSENIFLMKDGTVKVGDFGISKVLDHTLSFARTQIGTPYYISPEICKGNNYNSKSDIWSLGCILYELLTKNRPFEAANLCTLVTKITSQAPQPISHIYSNDMKNLVNLLLNKDPQQRPSITQILNVPLLKSRLVTFLDKTLRGARFQESTQNEKMFFSEQTQPDMNTDQVVASAKKKVEDEKEEKARQEAAEKAKQDEQRRKIFEEDQRAARQNRERVEAAMGGRQMKSIFQQGDAPRPKTTASSTKRAQLTPEERLKYSEEQRKQYLANKERMKNAEDVQKEIEESMKTTQELTMRRTAAFNHPPPSKNQEDVMKEINDAMMQTEKKLKSPCTLR